MILSTLLPLTLLSSTTLAIPGPKQPLAHRGSCPPNFRNTVFNTGAPRNAGWPSTIWHSLSANGVSDWIGFTEQPLNLTPTYDLANGKPAPVTPALNAAQIPICMDPRYVSDAVKMLKSSSPPAYLELFNEPDFSYMGFTPLTSPEDAAKALAPIFALGKLKTQLIAPAVAFTNSDWLTKFDAACGQCIEKHIPIVSAHLYSPNPDTIMSMVTTLHKTWPSKKIWITELAPASSSGQGCTLDGPGVIKWMNTVVPRLAATGYVDRIFWNSGEHVSFFPLEAHTAFWELLTDAGRS